MTSSARRLSPRKPPPAYPWLFWLLASGLWTFLFWIKSPPGSAQALQAWVAYAKGSALLALAAAAYFSLSRGLWPRSFSTLSLYPLAWLAASGMQWHLCVEAPSRDWLSVLFFLGLVFWIGLKPDGKKLLPGLLLGWVGLVLLWPQALFLPLVYLAARQGLFKNVLWVKVGGAAIFLILLAATRAWSQFHFNWLDFSDWFIGKQTLAFEVVFGFLVLLGWAAFPRKGTHRSALASVGLLSLGTLVLNPFFLGHSPGNQAIGWVCVWAAGFGFESLRRDLLDPSWHGRAAWAMLGLAAFWGVF